MRAVYIGLFLLVGALAGCGQATVTGSAPTYGVVGDSLPNNSKNISNPVRAVMTNSYVGGGTSQ